MQSDLIKRVSDLDTACLCDANPQFRALDSGLRPINPDLRLCGRVLTVACDGDFLSVLKALQEAEDGDVLVIANQGERAIAGELFATECLRRNLGGLVVDGAIRDTRSVKDIAIPVYARSAHPKAGTSNTVSRYHVPIECGGVAVHPGDVIFGDADGLIVGSLEEFESSLATAERIRQTEILLLHEMRQGKSIFEFMNFDEHYENCLHGRSSTLQFELPENIQTNSRI